MLLSVSPLITNTAYRSQSPTECKWKIARILNVNSLIDWHFTFDMMTVIFGEEKKETTDFSMIFRAILFFLVLTPSSMSNYICWIISFPSRQSSAQGTSSNKNRRLFRSLSFSLYRHIFRI